MTRAELEGEIETESAKLGRTVGWGCNTAFTLADGTRARRGLATHIRVSTFNSAGFRKTVILPISDGKTPSDLIDEFLVPTIREVRRRRKIRKLEAELQDLKTRG